MEKDCHRIGFFLVHDLNAQIGGMEVHQKYFIHHFFYSAPSTKVMFEGIIENKENSYTLHNYKNGSCVGVFQKMNILELKDLLLSYESNDFLFFLNDGWWIQEIPFLRTNFPGCRIIMRTGGNDIELAPWNEGNYNYLERRIMWSRCINSLDYIIANSDFTIRRLERLGIRKEIIIKIRGGVDMDLAKRLYARKKKLREKVRKTLGIQHKYIIAFACRFVPFKGVKEALQAFCCSEVKKDSYLLLIGHGYLLDEIRNWTKCNIDHGQFTFTGGISNNEVMHYLAASDITINPSQFQKTKSGEGWYYHTETMGRTMMESISVGTPLLATNVGGTNELFSECDYIGEIVEPDVESLKRGFELIPYILQRKVIAEIDYGWDTLFSLYENQIFRC